MNQRKLEEQITNTLKRMDFHDVSVAVDSQGIAELSGAVANADERAIVAALARTTPGVAGIVNQIGVTQ